MTAQPRRWITIATDACLLLFTLALPLSKAVTEIAYSAALALWMIDVFLYRRRPWKSNLTPAWLAFLLCSAISTLLSPAPMFSWDRMKSVALLMIAPIFAHNVRGIGQARKLILALIVATMAGVGYTAWSYVNGIGARMEHDNPAIAALGIGPGDLIAQVNGHSVHNPQEFDRELESADPGHPVTLELERTEWLYKNTIASDRDALLHSGLTERGVLGVGRPLRAKGPLGTTVTYAEVLSQMTVLAWGLLLAAGFTRRRSQTRQAGHPRQTTKTIRATTNQGKWAVLFLVAFATSCIALGATLTRASLVSCFVASLIVFWLWIPRKGARALSLAALLVVILGTALLVRHGRRLGLIASSDPGSEYRVLMWKDGVRLALGIPPSAFPPWRRVVQQPLFGIGMDSIKVFWKQFGIRAYDQFPLRSHFHSTPIQLVAERGWLTLAAWIWILVVYFRLLLKMRKQVTEADWFSGGMALGILGAAMAFVGSSFVHFNLGDSEVQMLFWCLMGTAAAIQRSTSLSANQTDIPSQEQF